MKLLYNSNSIFLRIGLAVGSVMALLLLSLFTYLVYEITSTKNLTKEITAELSSANVLDKIDRNFYERFGDVQAFAYNELAEKTLDSSRPANGIQSFINTMTTYYVLYDLMMVVDADGKVLVTNTVDKKGIPIPSEFMIGRNFSDQEWFKACMTEPGPDGGAWYSKFNNNHDVAQIYKSNGYGMGFAAPIRDKQGKIKGVWFNFASWKEITQSIRTEAEHDLNIKEPGSLIILTRPNGEVIDAADENLIKMQLSVTEKETGADSKMQIILKDTTLHLKDYIARWGVAKGAYTYKGRNWKAVTLIPETKVSLATLFSVKLITIYSSIFLIVSVCGYFLYSYFYKRVVDKIHRIKYSLDRIAAGEVVSVEADLQTKDEIGEIGMAMAKVAKNIEKTSNFAESIGKGQLDIDYTTRGDKDVLGIALLNMQENLSKVREQELHRNWATEGLAKFGDIVRKYADNTSHMADIMVSELVKYTGANQCMLYTAEMREDQQQKFLRLAACYAYDRKKYLQKEIELGEGLAGQAYLEKEMNFLTDIPENYMQITSGLGAGKPSCIIIVPLLYESEVMGVLEMASFDVLPEYKRNFLEKVAVVIASALRNLLINTRTNLLLQETQMMMDQVKTQEEEMRQNMEELTATQEESERKQERFQKEISLYQQVLDILPVGIYIKDEDARYTIINRTERKELGISPNQYLPMTEEELEESIHSTQNYSEHQGLNGKSHPGVSAKNQVKKDSMVEIPFVNPISGEQNILGVSSVILPDDPTSED